jgi:hypothetical protein
MLKSRKKADLFQVVANYCQSWGFVNINSKNKVIRLENCLCSSLLRLKVKNKVFYSDVVAKERQQRRLSEDAQPNGGNNTIFYIFVIY